MNLGELTKRLDIVHSLKTTKEIETHLRPILADMGVDWWVAGVLDPESYVLPRSHIVATWPISWGLEYKLRGYAKIDYVLKGVNDRLLPLIWNTQDPSSKSPSDIKFDQCLARRNWLCGVCFYTRSHQNHRGILNFSFQKPLEKVETIIQQAVPVGNFIAMNLMAAMINIRQPDCGRKSTESLSAREEEVLRWYVDGKTPWEIGTILGISERTVRAHMDCAVEKCGLCTKREILTKATAAGIVNPNLENLNDCFSEWVDWQTKA